MKDHLHQPLLFNPAIYNSSDGKQHINYKYITVPQTMLVYSLPVTWVPVTVTWLPTDWEILCIMKQLRHISEW